MLMRFGRLAMCLVLCSVVTASAETDKKDTVHKSWNVDEAHGTFSDSIPIQVPPFHGVTPYLQLGYDSSDGNGLLGVGWSLRGVGQVVRASPGKGAPNYDSNDIYLLNGQELVACAAGSVSPSCTTGGTHSTKIENYERIAFSGSGYNSSWTVTAKDGTQSVYGQVYSADASPDDPWKWGLTKVLDTLGKEVTYTWGFDEFSCCWWYPASISYNDTTVTFYYEQRPDLEKSGDGTGFETVQGRLKTIDVTVSGNRVRAYKLDYTTSDPTGRSLLTSVQQYGTDATLDGSGTVTGGTSHPAITMNYQGGGSSPAFETGNADYNVHSSTMGTQVFAMDINGDGMTDMLELYTLLGIKHHKVWLSDGTQFVGGLDQIGMSSLSTAQYLPMDVNGDGMSDLVELFVLLGVRHCRIWVSNGTGFTEASDQLGGMSPLDMVRFLPMDVNGDGMSDLVELDPAVLFPGLRTWLSTGSEFTLVSDVYFDWTVLGQYLPMDVNGDGKSDLVSLKPTVGTYNRQIWISNGTGFDAGTADRPASGQVWESKEGDIVTAWVPFLPMDVNGDGKADMVELDPGFGESRIRRTWLSTGSSFILTETALLGYCNAGDWFLAMDVNGDGRSDLVSIEATLLHWEERRIWLSESDGFVAGASDTQWDFGPDTVIMAADVNGDGLAEMISVRASGISPQTRRIWPMTGPYPDILTSIKGSLGATTTVSYLPSSTWDNTNNPPLMQTVRWVTIDDGRESSGTTQYSYAGGLYDRLERRFLGFRYEWEQAPCIESESECPVKKTSFLQDYGSVSKPEVIEYRRGAGDYFSVESYYYTNNGSTVPYTSLLRDHYVTTHEGGGVCPAGCRETRVWRSYNEYGEVVEEIDYNDANTSGDEHLTYIEYYPNTTDYIVKPGYVNTYAGTSTSGELLNQTRYYYDDGALDQAPSQGLVTQTWKRLDGSWVKNWWEYDAWGNVTAEINHLGKRTEYTFDSTYHLFETSQTNPLGQTTSTEWDFTCGKGTQFTDLNGQPTTMTYDSLCRMMEMDAPGGMYEDHSWVNMGDPSTQHELIQTPSADGTNPLWTKRYFDGLGRTWRTVASGPDAATGDIYVDIGYNARGKEAWKTAPYYSSDGLPSGAQYTMYDYDGADRLTRVTHPDGAFTTRSYGRWSVTETDELGRSKTDHFNADGQRVKHEEWVDGALQTTTYTYDLRGYLTESTDPLGNVVSYSVDMLGRRTELLDPDWGNWTYEYNSADQLTARTDAKGQRTEFGYDALGRRTWKTSLAGTGSAETVYWIYDEPHDSDVCPGGCKNVGKLTTTLDSTGYEQYFYSAAGNIVKTIRQTDASNYATYHVFDAGNRLLYTIYPDGDGLGTPSSPLQYDGAGRLTSIPGYVTSAQYAADGVLVQVNNANGTVTTRSHSLERGWLTAISTTLGGATIQDLDYTRNDKGLITGVESPFPGEGWTYEYDDLDRLIAATNTSNPASNQTFSYDAIGNVTSNSKVGTYTYGVRPHAVTRAGVNTYAYDDAGLMISGAGRTMDWNGNNALASVLSGGKTMTYTYDANGARIKQYDGSTTRHYLGGGYEVPVGGSAIKYVTLAGSVVARKEGTTKTRVHTDHLGSIRAEKEGTTKTRVHTDHLGSIQAETDASGNEVHRKKYRPYGEILSTEGPLAYESRGFTGQRHDASGLVFLHARYYDPALARFISPDPIISSSDTIGLNRYAYAANDPIGKTDIDGFMPHDEKYKPTSILRAGGNTYVSARKKYVPARKKIIGGVRANEVTVRDGKIATGIDNTKTARDPNFEITLRAMAKARMIGLAPHNRPYIMDGVMDCWGYTRQVWNAILDPDDGGLHREDFAWSGVHYDKKRWLKTGAPYLPVNDGPNSGNWALIGDLDNLLTGDVLSTHKGHAWGGQWHGGLYFRKEDGTHYVYDSSPRTSPTGAYKRPFSGSGFQYYYTPVHDLLLRNTFPFP